MVILLLGAGNYTLEHESASLQGRETEENPEIRRSVARLGKKELDMCITLSLLVLFF